MFVCGCSIEITTWARAPGTPTWCFDLVGFRYLEIWDVAEEKKRGEKKRKKKKIFSVILPLVFPHLRQ